MPKDINRIVYFILETGETESSSYRDFVCSFAEYTTSPRGVEPKFHLRGLELWTWGTSGNHPRLVSVNETEAEADSALFETFEIDRRQSSRDNRCWDSKEEAEAELIKQDM